MGNITSSEPLALKRRVEEASLNAWPAMQQVLLDGWLLRFSKGFTKRANCIVPLYPSLGNSADSGTLEEKVRYCENLYAREQLQSIFRLTSLHKEHVPGALNQLLDRRNYATTEETLVLTRPITNTAGSAAGSATGSPEAGFRLLALEEWLGVYSELANMPEAAATLHKVILQGIQARCAFAALAEGGTWVACGLAVLEQDLLGLFDIVTHPRHRQRGHARNLVGALLSWGGQHQAQQAYLQMVADNSAAAELYRQLEFQTLYNYWYRVPA